MCACFAASFACDSEEVQESGYSQEFMQSLLLKQPSSFANFRGALLNILQTSRRIIKSHKNKS